VALILVIDDDESLRHMISSGLVAMGHEVLQAESGRQALAKFGSNKIDLVITDVLLPDIDGLELIPQFRKLSPSTKIIAISGGGRVGPKAYLGTAKMLGAERTVAKPFSPLQLQNAVTDLLAGEA
jgi:CheY-like chemotaxis protein